MWYIAILENISLCANKWLIVNRIIDFKFLSFSILAKTITDADYADDIAILANTPDQAETQLHSLERAAAGIGLYVNADKTE